jgi:hypothetical protein
VARLAGLADADARALLASVLPPWTDRRFIVVAGQERQVPVTVLDRCEAPRFAYDATVAMAVARLGFPDPYGPPAVSFPSRVG